MFSATVEMDPNYKVLVHTTERRGHTPEEVAKRCADRLISVSENAPPAIKDQALAYRNQVENLLSLYMREAINSDRTTIFNALNDAGHPQLAELIRRL